MTSPPRLQSEHVPDAAILPAEAVAGAAGPLLADPVPVFALVMLIILIVPMLMQRLRLPGTIGIILAGALAGPTALNLLARDGVIEVLGTVGLLYLMFVVGMSLDLHQFTQTRRRSLSFGAMSFFVPQVLGVTAGLHLLGYDVPTALLLGSIVGSHTLLAYPAAKRLGITGNRAVTMSIGGTIVTDGLSLSILAVVAAMAVGELTGLFWLRFTGLVGAFVLLVIFGLPALGRWFFRTFPGRGDLEFVFLMVILFVAAAASDVVGLAPIVGAFLAGLTMNRLVPDTGPLMNRLHFVGDALFIPFFLLSVGMLVNVRVLLDFRQDDWAQVWMLAGVFTLLVLVGKFIAAGAARVLFRLNRDEAWTAFGLTIPQAAATLAVTLVGFQLGMFGTLEVNGVVLMILLTCLLGPWLVDHFGRRVALQDESAEAEPGSAPLRILIPLANPASAPALMDVAFMIRRPTSPEPLYPLMVANETGDVQAQVAAGEKVLGYAVIYAAGAGVPVIPATRIDVNIANGITRAVRELRISTVVIGWSGEPSMRRRHLGQVLDQILNENPQTLLVCKFNTPINTSRRVLVVLPRLIDREPSFAEAMRTIKLMTSKLGAKLVVIATESDIQRLEKRLTKIKPGAPTSFEPLPTWSSLLPRLGGMVQSDDLVLLLSTREGRLAWSPDLGRLPRRLVENFPENNLILFFPSEVTAETAWFARSAAGHALAPGLAMLGPERALLGIRPGSFEEAVEEILQPALGETPAALRAVRDALIRAADEYSTEVSPGIALLHAHVPHVSTPTLFLATVPEGLRVPRAASAVEVVLVLLSPEAVPPEEHLRALASIARMMREPDIGARIARVRTFEELGEVLGESVT